MAPFTKKKESNLLGLEGLTELNVQMRKDSSSFAKESMTLPLDWEDMHDLGMPRKESFNFEDSNDKVSLPPSSNSANPPQTLAFRSQTLIPKII